MFEEVQIEKLVHGGQGLGTLPDGRKVFVWNALPGEKVRVKLWKRKKSFAEGIAEEIIVSSPDRIEPEEPNFLATSPWQIMTFEAENKHKKEIVDELFQRDRVHLPAYEIRYTEYEYDYRNKMEYSFYGDDDGIHLALYNRGSHQKQIVQGSKLAMPALDTAANAVLAQLNALSIRAGDLKTIIVRCSQESDVAASLFVKRQDFPEVKLPPQLKGLRVYYSNPKSPASVPTELLREQGLVLLQDELLGREFVYDVDSFFQVNVPIFERALARMKEFANGDELVDMYAGVGSIGLSLAKKSVTLVELDPATAAMARKNAHKSELEAKVIETSTEKALDYVMSDRPIIFDPPRAGLHPKLTERVLEVLPPRVLYLSCNPATHARDLGLLQEKYSINFFEVYNFFPRTPHIETLAVLERK